MSAVLMIPIDRSELASNLAAEAVRIVETMRGIDLRTVEQDEEGAVRRRHVAQLRASLDDAAQLLSSAEESFDGNEPETPEQFVVDVAAMASVVIAEKRRLLQHVDDDTDRWEVIDRCDRALRAMVRSLTALENALADSMGVLHRLAVDDELAKALRIRPLYEKFRRAVREYVGDENRPLLQRVRSAGTSIAMLVGREEYPLMRAGDRILVRKLRQRLLDWIGSATHDESEALHLCSELLSIAELLMAINSRAELIEYDRTRTGPAAMFAVAPNTNQEGEEDGKNR